MPSLARDVQQYGGAIPVASGASATIIFRGLRGKSFLQVAVYDTIEDLGQLCSIMGVITRMIDNDEAITPDVDTGGGGAAAHDYNISGTLVGNLVSGRIVTIYPKVPGAGFAFDTLIIQPTITGGDASLIVRYLLGD